MNADSGFTIHRDADLADRNTLRVRAQVERLIDIHDARVLPAVLALPEVAAAPCRVLGEGSNILITGNIAGALLSLRGSMIQVLALDADTARLRVEAGHSWHTFVMHTIDQGLAGLENLALIPGTVGAAPIQNIGAYGVEVGEHVLGVEVFDRQQHAFRTLSRSQCAFGYRDSLFKRDPERFIVTAVTFELSRHDRPKLDYAGIREELEASGVSTPTARNVAEAVIRLRRRKLPDPAVLPNAGSFFKNPVVNADTAVRLMHEYPSIVSWPMDLGRKLSAGWLIEQAGLKGARDGDAGIAATHALVLVNHGQADGPALVAFASFVRKQVAAKFGVELEPEPVYW